MSTATFSEVPGLCARVDLTSAQRAEMFLLLSSHFEGVTRDQFEADLAEKNWVIQVRRNGQLLGFSTLLLRELEFEGERFTAVFSGDTIVARNGWNSPELARTWITAVNHLRGELPGRRCYWLLLTSGFRTYRLLPLFWREFFPRFDRPTPVPSQRLLDFLAFSQYGDAFDRATGLVRFPRPQRLRGVLRELSDGRATDPHVAFFCARNRAHLDGDELVCLTEIAETNLTPAGARMVSERKR